VNSPVKLGIHEIETAGPLAVNRSSLPIPGAAQQIVIGMMPVQSRVVDEELDTLAMTLFGKLTDDVFAVGVESTMLYLFCVVANMEKPSWWREVTTMERMPACWASVAHRAAANFVG